MTILSPFSFLRATGQTLFRCSRGWKSRFRLLPLLLTCCLLPGLFSSLAACASSTQAQQPDPRLKNFHILSSRIIIMDTQAEVDGTVQNTGHDSFPFDVTIDATFYNSAGKVIGHAQGVAEDVYPGMIGSFVLLGQVDNVSYSRMSLAPVSLHERRMEPNVPTPTAVVP